jgi:hypothetical protein
MFAKIKHSSLPTVVDFINILCAYQISCTVIHCMHTPVQCFQNALAYFSRAVTWLLKNVYKINTCGLYYNHMMIVNDDSCVISEQSF